MCWSPLPKILCGKVIKPFTPFLDHPSLTANKKTAKNFRNMYPGDLVYIFETHSSSKWVRGYLLSQLNPSDFSLASVSNDVIEESNISVVVFPLSHADIIREIDVTAADDEVEVVMENGQYGYAFNGTETEVRDGYSLVSGSTNSSAAAKKTKRPAMPVNDYAMSIDSLIGEIEAALRGLNIQLFAMYTRGDLLYFRKMVELFQELDDIKSNVQYGLMTRYEVKQAKKKTAFLMTLMSKLIAAGTGKKSKKDIAGYESILARDEVTGELFVPTRDEENLPKAIKDVSRLAQNQLFGALSPNFPIANSDIKTYPERSKQFVQSFPSHIKVDFKAFSGSCHDVPDGYLGFTAYVYLRNSKKRLTEAYAIQVGQNNDIMIDGLSSALFKNIPANEVDSGRIYLVTLITEKVQMKVGEPKNGVPNLQTIRKGMCAGVVDISRIFTRRKDHLNPDEVHEFSMKLYASYLSEDTQAAPFQLYPGMNPLLAMSMTMDNNGWGELIDRIISGSNKGIAINPRIDRLSFTIKELKNEAFFSEVHSDHAIDVIRTLFYDPMEGDYDRIYLKLVKATDIKKSFLPQSRKKAPDFITVEVRGSSKQLRFSKGSNEVVQSNWHFVSTTVDEHVGEVIQITGLPTVPSNENDFLYFDVYVNGVFHGEEN
ncbi:unnamed protein product [Ambrosiozyma monospora]|uniref:Unnamed protein product n=1 Tax=Ambrosiozyma monospora TaxID=43982 RepID=A0ACB5T2B1_AMBMO|nr:unnamed protein product [Ambrosiozyma monospora]